MSLLWDKILRPMAFKMDAERAHELGVEALELGLATPYYKESLVQPVERFGLKFRNPLGVAAGFDKNGCVVEQLASLGFGFVEVGTVTARPQPGNPKPRLFRFSEQQALINRLGFNNDGAAVVAARLRKVRRKCVIGVNIGRNKDVSNENAIENYIEAFNILQPEADYVAVNISSPNTPNLRDLQQVDALTGLLSALQAMNLDLGKKPLLVKIAPDLGDGQVESIVTACIDQGIDGIIATNTTVMRERLLSPDRDDVGPGGLSGRPLTELSNRIISSIHRHSNGNLPIIGVGGIFDAQDAFDKLAAGASLIQAYTGFVYKGPGFANAVTGGLGNILNKKGFSSLEEAIGSSVVV